MNWLSRPGSAGVTRRTSRFARLLRRTGAPKRSRRASALFSSEPAHRCEPVTSTPPASKNSAARFRNQPSKTPSRNTQTARLRALPASDTGSTVSPRLPEWPAGRGARPGGRSPRAGAVRHPGRAQPGASNLALDRVEVAAGESEARLDARRDHFEAGRCGCGRLDCSI